MTIQRIPLLRIFGMCLGKTETNFIVLISIPVNTCHNTISRGIPIVLVLHLEKAIVVVIYIALSKVTWMICVVSY